MATQSKKTDSKYRPWHWQPVPVDRGVGVDVEKPPAEARVK